MHTETTHDQAGDGCQVFRVTLPRCALLRGTGEENANTGSIAAQALPHAYTVHASFAGSRGAGDADGPLDVRTSVFAIRDCPYTSDRVYPPKPTGYTLENPLNPGARSTLTMLTFGDSAMWGNGLSKHYKYAFLVAQHVRRR